MKHLRLAAAALVVTVLGGAASAGAAPSIGPPLDATSGLRIAPGTYQLAPMRVADPDGGPPWGMATYFASPPSNNRVLLLCTEYGRVVNEQLGVFTIDSVFRPFRSGQGPIAACGGVNSSRGDRAVGDGLRVMPARIGGACSPEGLMPIEPECKTARMRTLMSASMGRGILSAEIKDHGSTRWRTLPVTSDGMLLAVRDGVFTDITLPAIRVRATVCGPDARTDIRGWRMVRQGCAITFEIPNGPRPARETAASRRARRSDRLRVPIRVIERPGRSSLTRYSARLRLPITVRTFEEGYAAEVRGPSGRDCKSRGWTNTGNQYISSYLQVAGKPYDVPIVPIDYRRGVWCRGKYRLTVLFKRRHGAGRRTRVTRKVVGTAAFSIR